MTERSATSNSSGDPETLNLKALAQSAKPLFSIKSRNDPECGIIVATATARRTFNGITGEARTLLRFQ
jgi:hypothetical protein